MARGKQEAFKIRELKGNNAILAPMKGGDPITVARSMVPEKAAINARVTLGKDGAFTSGREFGQQTAAAAKAKAGPAAAVKAKAAGEGKEFGQQTAATARAGEMSGKVQAEAAKKKKRVKASRKAKAKKKADES